MYLCYKYYFVYASETKVNEQLFDGSNQSRRSVDRIKYFLRKYKNID